MKIKRGRAGRFASWVGSPFFDDWSPEEKALSKAMTKLNRWLQTTGGFAKVQALLGNIKEEKKKAFLQKYRGRIVGNAIVFGTEGYRRFVKEVMPLEDRRSALTQDDNKLFNRFVRSQANSAEFNDYTYREKARRVATWVFLLEVGHDVVRPFMDQLKQSESTSQAVKLECEEALAQYREAHPEEANPTPGPSLQG